MAKSIGFGSVCSEYSGLWASCSVRPQHKAEVERKARQILNNRPRYDVVSRATGVPWYVIGLIHAMECSQFPSFTQHLHNGDRLTARTHLVPRGRPLKGEPPFTWEDSAIDALTMPGKEFDKIQEWSLERIAYSLETYNGWGYRLYHPEIHTPYLWSYTTAYAGGKYIADGVWSSTAVSEQPGAMAILKALIEIDAGQIDLFEPRRPATSWPRAGASDPPPPTTTRMMRESKTVRYQAAAIVLAAVAKFKAAAIAVGGGLAWLVEQLPDVTKEAGDNVSAVKDFAALIGAGEVVAGVATTMSVAFAVTVIVRHLRDRTELKTIKGE